MSDLHHDISSECDCSSDLSFSSDVLNLNSPHEVECIDITNLPDGGTESDSSETTTCTDSTNSFISNCFNNIIDSDMPASTSCQEINNYTLKHKIDFSDSCTVAKQPKLDVPEGNLHRSHSLSPNDSNGFDYYSCLTPFEAEDRFRPYLNNHEILRPFLDSNHTITSGEYEDASRHINNNLQTPIDESNLGITTVENQISLKTVPNDSLHPKHESNSVYNSPQHLISLDPVKRNDHVLGNSDLTENMSDSKTQTGEGEQGLHKICRFEPPAFYQLLDIFPDIDTQFLKYHCQQSLDLIDLTNHILEMNNNYPKSVKPPELNNKCNESHFTTQQLSSLNILDDTEKLLIPVSSCSGENFAPKNNMGLPTNTVCVHNHAEVKPNKFHDVSSQINDTTKVKSQDTNEDNESNQYDFLLKIFPDADKIFLKTKSKLKGSELEIFIAENLEKGDYPRLLVEKAVITADETNAVLIPGTSQSNESLPDITAIEIKTAVSSSNGSRKKLRTDADTNSQNKEIPQGKSSQESKKLKDKQFDFLLGIFPDADPTFLETKSKLKGDELKMFIAETLEKRDYPRLKIKKEVVNEEEFNEFGLYTTMFNINKFLKIFPDPFKYFCDKQRKCEKSNHAVEFMKRRYRNHSNKVISELYKEHGFSLVITCDVLDNIQNTRTTKRGLNEIHMPTEINLPFLQEACFVEHKTDIKNHIESVEEAKKNAYEKAKANNELIECGCCYDQVLFEDCATCSEGDLFCKPCIQKSAEVRIGDGLITFPCLIDCTAQFSFQLLQNLLEARVFSKLLQRIQIDEVKSAEIEGLESCPFCEFASIPPPETRIFTCLNPECLKESCRQCHKVSHIPLRCEEVENDDQAKARKYIEDEMTRALVRECYKCKKSFIKMDGCNKMTCTCGARMCYICRKPITDYTHFNGPGGSNDQKCPLYSTEKLLHVDAVKDIAKKALNDVKAANPNLNLKHDPTKVLPSSKATSNFLPPGVDEQPQQLLANLQAIAALGYARTTNAYVENILAGNVQAANVQGAYVQPAYVQPDYVQPAYAQPAKLRAMNVNSVQVRNRPIATLRHHQQLNQHAMPRPINAAINNAPIQEPVRQRRAAQRHHHQRNQRAMPRPINAAINNAPIQEPVGQRCDMEQPEWNVIQAQQEIRPTIQRVQAQMNELQGRLNKLCEAHQVPKAS